MSAEWEEIPLNRPEGAAMTPYQDLLLSLLSNLVELVRKQGEVLEDLRTILADVVGFKVKEDD